jgi:adenosylmethionine-8-amino-7-oxononanoate aminotransferase
MAEARASRRLWHPFAVMGKVDGHELVLVRGEGCRVWDADGAEYLDATAGLWFANVGHGRAEIAEAVATQLRTLASHHIFGDQANPPALELAGRIAGLAPLPDSAVFFGSSGGEAIDTAAKIARRYWVLAGEPQRTAIVSRRYAYHGTNAYGTSLSGIPAVRDGFGALVGGVAEVAHDDPDDLARTLDVLGDRAAAFLGEPMIGAGGAIPPADGYWTAVERICRERGVLLIADEVICGFGRLGRWFGCERYGFTPDLITCAKGISSGYIPLGAVIVSDHVRAPFWQEDAAPFAHGGTYAGHPAACVAGLVNIDILEREQLIERAATLEPLLGSLLAPLLEQPGVAEVRSVGLAGAVELEADLLAANPTLGASVVAAARRHGVITRLLRGVALQISPPLVVTEDELAAMVGGIGSAVHETVAALAPHDDPASRLATGTGVSPRVTGSTRATAHRRRRAPSAACREARGSRSRAPRQGPAASRGHRRAPRAGSRSAPAGTPRARNPRRTQETRSRGVSPSPTPRETCAARRAARARSTLSWL